MPRETVAVRQFRGPDKWQRGVVVQCLGLTSYIVQVANRTLHVHVHNFIPAPEEVDNMQVTVVHPTLVPDRPTGPYAEVRNPAHSLGPTPLEQPSPVPTASTPVPAPAVPAPESASTEGSSPVSVMPDLPVRSTGKSAAEPLQPTPPLPWWSTCVQKQPVLLDLWSSFHSECTDFHFGFVSVSFRFTNAPDWKGTFRIMHVNFLGMYFVSFHRGEGSVMS